MFKEDSTNQGKPHPYFALALDADSDTKKAFELSKLKAPYTEVYEAKNGAVVKVSPFADESDLAKNLKSAIVIADNLGVSMNIRPHLEIQNHKNPEYEMNDIIGDRAEPKSDNIKKGISNTFDKKLGKKGQLKEQKSTFIVIDISGYELTKENIEAVVNQSWSKINYYKDYLECFFLVHKDNAIMLKTELVNKGYEEYKKEVLKMQKSKT